MKKTLVALAVAAVAATSANATVVYNQDGTKIGVSGRVALVVSKTKETRTDLYDNGSRFRIDASQELGTGFSALGAAELRFGNKNNEFKDIVLKRLYAGLKHDNVGTLTFGKQLTIGDDVTVADYTYNGFGANTVISSGDKVIRLQSPDLDGLTLEADYVFSGSNKKGEPNADGFVVGAKYETSYDDFGVNLIAAYSQKRIAEHKVDKVESHKLKGLAVGAEVSHGPVAVAFNWANEKGTPSTEAGKLKRDLFEVGAKYQFTDVNSIYGQYYWGNGKLTKADKTTKGKLKGWFVGADHKFAKNVLVYLEGGKSKGEVGLADMSKDGKEKVVHAGLRVLF
ncbi:porin [Seminibacterium arietis]|uniref:Porin n=1 Tax=Seminibacterium arietis TaxID=1173502 RepID=A0ABW3I8H1_9PAST